MRYRPRGLVADCGVALQPRPEEHLPPSRRRKRRRITHPSRCYQLGSQVKACTWRPHCHGALQLYIPRIVPPINGGSMDEYRGPFDGYVYKDSMGGFAKFLIFCVLIVAIGALLAFWPGQYQYYTAQGGILVRVNRYSGVTEQYFDGIGWGVPKPAADASGKQLSVNPSDKPIREAGVPTPTPSQREDLGKPTPTSTKGK